MRRKVTIQELTDTKDEYGQVERTWSDVYATGAVIRQVSFKETEGDELKVASDSLRLEIPYSQKGLDVTTKDYVSISGIRYEIENVDTTTQFRKKIILTCSQHNEM